MIFTGKTDEFLLVTDIEQEISPRIGLREENTLSMVWATDHDVTIQIDGADISLEKHQMVFYTEFHNVKMQQPAPVRFIRFNRAFFCIIDHDSEIGCKGILFFGAAGIPVISIGNEELEQFDLLWKVFLTELETKDNLQIEMLQMVLKRFLILCTRLYKKQAVMITEDSGLDIIREFNFLVERNFKSMHYVADYADLLNKSPKTLSNLFAGIGHRSPRTIIHDRLQLEARRLLHYTDKSVKEIGYELGFEDIQAFSRFFRNKEGIAPTDFREYSLSGKTANKQGNPA